MKFFIIFLLLNFIIFDSSFVQANSSTTSETPIKSESPELSMWKIHGPEGEMGTGFFIGENLFVTNFHVIANNLDSVIDSDIIANLLEKNIRSGVVNRILMENIFNATNKDEQNLVKNESDIETVENFVLSQKGNPTVIKVKKNLTLSALHDLALLETEEKVTHYLNLKQNPPKASEPLFIPAYPNGTFKKISKTGNIFYEDNQEYNFPINHFNLSGASGSPILDKQGQVVGVHFSAIEHLSGAIKVNHLEELITENTELNCFDFFNLKHCIIREMESLKDLAHRGNPAAQFRLAHIYFHFFYMKYRIEQILKTMLKWYKEAAEKNHVPAQYDLASMYHLVV